MVDITFLLSQMVDKDTSTAYKALQELEDISDENGLVYQYTEKFCAMITNEKYVVRVRGFRLFCKQAKWDVDFKLDKHINYALSILKDEKPTAVRQALAALHDVVKHKPALRETVYRAAKDIDYLKYKETMHNLISKDIQEILTLMQVYN